MKLLILLFAISRLCECSLPYYGVTVGLSPYSRPVVSQYHRQDNYGHYVYGYATDLSSKDEVKTPDGVTRGGYSYIDANGILQTVHYISDPVNGFRVQATNIPKDVPAVAHARAQHLAQFEHIKAEHAAIAESRKYQPILSPVLSSGGHIVPVKTNVIAQVPVPISFQPIVVDEAPIEPIHQVVPVQANVPVEHAVAYTPAVALSSQYHSQDSLGQYSYGYADPNSAKSETKTADGVTRGGYSYIDANGILQSVHYVADPVNGFRVTGTNLPQAPSVTLIGPKVSATVVGPQDNNAAAAIVPAADTVIAPAVNVVPVHSTHIDSIAIEQKPVLAQADIILNANVPVVSPEGPYIQPNPNHQTPVVYTNPELTAPFQPPHTPEHINPQVYAAAPLPATHSQAVLHDRDPVYNIPPALQNHQISYNPELIQQTGQPTIPIHHQHQEYIQQHQQEQIILNGQEHGPSRVQLGQYAQEQSYIHNQPQQILVAPNEHAPVPQQVQYSQEEHLQLQNIQNQQIQDAHNAQVLGNHQIQHGPQGHQQILANYDGRYAEESNRPNQEFYLRPNAQVPTYGHENQQIYLTPEGHQSQQVTLGSGEHRGQIYTDSNQASNRIQLAGELAAPSHDQHANYYAAEYAVPINAEAINNGPSNQQVLNHGGAHSQLAFQPTDSAAYGNSQAYEGAYTYGVNPAYGKQISTQGGNLFVPDGVSPSENQQVYQQQAPVEHGPQVAQNIGQQQAYIAQHEQQAHASLQSQTGVQGQHATAPSGYYTQNIQY